MGLSAAEKALNIGLALLVAAAYGGLLWWRLKRTGRPKAELVRWLRLEEPAVIVDSARLIVLLLWITHLPPLARLAAHLDHPVSLVDTRTILYRFLDTSVVEPWHLYVAAWAYRVGIVAAAVGIQVRWSAFVAAISYTFLWSTEYQYGHAGHNHIVVFVLLVLALTPGRTVSIFGYVQSLIAGRDPASVGTYPVYFRYALMAPVVTAYFQAGIEKLIRSGPYWVNGLTLQGHILSHSLYGKSEVLTSVPMSLLVALSILTLAWEVAFALVYLFPWLRLPAALSAASFHIAMQMLLGPPFYVLRRSLFLLFSPYELLRLFARRPALEMTDGARAPNWVLIAALAGVTAVQWVPTALRADKWYPVFNYVMFNGYYRGGETIPGQGRATVTTDDGHTKELPPRTFQMSAATFTEQLYIRYVSPHPRDRHYASQRKQYCQRLLSMTPASAREMTLALDYFVVGEPALQSSELTRCRRTPGPSRQ